MVRPSGDHTGEVSLSGLNVRRVFTPVTRSRSQKSLFRPGAPGSESADDESSAVARQGNALEHALLASRRVRAPFRSNHVGTMRGRVPAALVTSTPLSDPDTATASARGPAGPVTIRASMSMGRAAAPAAIDAYQGGATVGPRPDEHPLRPATRASGRAVECGDIRGRDDARRRACEKKPAAVRQEHGQRILFTSRPSALVISTAVDR